MRLQATRDYELIHYDPECSVVHWKFELMAGSDPESLSYKEHSVGRVLADELMLYELEEERVAAGDAADADSSGLEGAWAAIATKRGRFPFLRFPSADSVVYLYRFELHPDFSEWRMPFMDSVCRAFGGGGVILAQYHTTWLRQAEFKSLGFKMLPRSRNQAAIEAADIDRNTRFLLRDNSLKIKYKLDDYPEDAPIASEGHEKWLEAHGPWKDLL